MFRLRRRKEPGEVWRPLSDAVYTHAHQRGSRGVVHPQRRFFSCWRLELRPRLVQSASRDLLNPANSWGRGADNRIFGVGGRFWREKHFRLVTSAATAIATILELHTPPLLGTAIELRNFAPRSAVTSPSPPQREKRVGERRAFVTPRKTPLPAS